MQGPSHLALSWFLAESAGLQSPRDRRIVAWSGLMPDIEVLAYIGAIAYYRFDQGLAFEKVWQPLHRHYTHGLTFIALTGVAAWLIARTRSGGSAPAKVAGLAMLASAIHNFCDVVGGGAAWPIYPLWPFSEAIWSASWSWGIGEWPNVAILFAALGGTLLYARLAGRSPFECFGARADAWLIGVVRNEARPAAARGGGMLRWLIWGGLAIVTAAILAPLGFRLPL